MAQDQHTYNDFLNSLNKIRQVSALEEFPHLVICFGASDYLLLKTSFALKSSWNKLAENSSSIDAQDLDAETLGELVRETPIFSPKFLYVVRGVEKRSDFWRYLSEFKDKKDFRNCLTLLVNNPKILEKLRAEAKRLGATLIECVEPKPYEIPQYVGGVAKKYGLNLTNDAKNLVVECLGKELSVLDNEIKRLALIFPASQTILNSRDIAPYLNFLKEDLGSKLRNLILQHSYSHAQALIFSLLRRGESGLALLGMLAKHCRSSLKVSYLLRQGYTYKEIATKTQLQSYQIAGYAKYMESSSKAKLTAALKLCTEADSALKSSRVSEEVVLGQILASMS
jgi:DNA polymerase III delta subunit